MKKGKYIWTALHKWTGLVFGVLLTLICVTGAILSFEKELLPLTIHSRYYNTSPENTKPLKLQDLTEKITQSAPGRQVKSITFPSDPKRNLVASFADDPQTEVYVDPYTGEIVGSFTYKGSFFSTVRELHRFLLIGKPGRIITGTTSLFFVFILVSGIFINIPDTLRKLASNFRLNWSGNSFRKTFRLHVVLGWYGFVFLLIMALTGPFWSFTWYNAGVSALLGVKQTTSQRSKTPDQTGVKELNSALFSRMEDKVIVLKAVQSDWKELRLAFPAPEDKSFTIAVIPQKQIHGRQSDTFTYRLSDGDLQKESVFKTKPLQETFRMWVFALHTGSWGGWAGKLIYCISALIGATLPITGYILWWKKRQIAKRNSK
ncbi:MAG: PepSY-associated TM helix domain-containing protein [Bacteroidales bacterium]